MIRSAKNWIKTKPQLFDGMKLLSRTVFRRRDPAYNFFDTYSKHFGGPVRFLQIGANDGLRNDPIREHVIRNQWVGVLVEPIPGVFEILINNYRKLPNLSFVNAAISSSDQENFELWSFSEEFLQLCSEEEKLDYLRKVSTYREHVLRFLPESCDAEHCLTKIRVPCVSINRIYQDYFYPRHMDLLVIDAEGYEKEIIDSIDFEYFSPTTIFYESHNLGEKRMELEKILADRGYQIQHILGDSVATKT